MDDVARNTLSCDDVFFIGIWWWNRTVETRSVCISRKERSVYGPERTRVSIKHSCLLDLRKHCFFTYCQRYMLIIAHNNTDFTLFVLFMWLLIKYINHFLAVGLDNCIFHFSISFCLSPACMSFFRQIPPSLNFNLVVFAIGISSLLSV